MWSSLFSQSYTSLNGSIPSVNLSLSVNRIAILATSNAAKPSWNMALQLRQIAIFPDQGGESVQTWFQKIFLNQKTVVDVPDVPTPYTLRLEFPAWFTQMSVQIWDASEVVYPLSDPGFFNNYAGTPPSSGFVLRSDGYWVFLTLDSVRSIGSASSGAAIAASWCQTLFTHLWGAFDSTRCPVLTSSGQASSRGTSAISDWNANKRLTLPDYRDSVLVGAGSGRTRGALVGSNTNVLTVAQLPVHSHAGSSLAAVADHAHTAGTDSQGGHGHNITINAGGSHSHSLGVATTAASGTARNNPSVSPTASLPTDSQGSHSHTGSTDNQGTHGHTITINAAGGHIHTLTIASEGSGQSFSVVQKSAVEHLLISAGARS